MTDEVSHPAPTIYRPLVVASLGFGLIGVPLGSFTYLSFALSGYCDDRTTCGAPQPTWQLVALMAVITAMWMVAVLGAIFTRDDGVANRAKLIGTVLTVVCFHALVWLTVLSAREGAGYNPLLTVLLGAPIAAALAGGYTVRRVGDWPR